MKTVLSIIIFCSAIYIAVAHLDGEHGTRLVNTTDPPINATEKVKPSKLERKLRDEMLKALIDLMTKMIGGETVVCSSLNNGEKVVIEGNNSGRQLGIKDV